MIPYPLFLICVPIGLYYISRSLRKRFGRSCSAGTPSPAVASAVLTTTDVDLDTHIGLGIATIAANNNFPVRHLVETSLSSTNSSPIPNPDEHVGGGERGLETAEREILEPTIIENNVVNVQLQDELREDLIDLVEDRSRADNVIEPDQIQSANVSQYSVVSESEERTESGSQIEQDNKVTQGQAERDKAQLRHLIEMVESEGQYQQNGEASLSSGAGQMQMGHSSPLNRDHQDEHDRDEQYRQGDLQPSGEQDDARACTRGHVHEPADEAEGGEAIQRESVGAEQVVALECEVVRDLDPAQPLAIGSDGVNQKEDHEFQLGHQAEGWVETVELTQQVVTEPVNTNLIVTEHVMDARIELANANEVDTINQVVPEPVNTNQAMTQPTGRINQYVEQGNQKRTPENNRKLSAADSSVVDYQNVLPMRKAQYVTEEPSFSSELGYQLPIGHRPPSIARIENHALSPGMASSSGVMWAAHASPPSSFPPPPPHLSPALRDNGEPIYMWNGPGDGLASPQSPHANQCLVPDPQANQCLVSDPQAADNNNAYYQSYTLFVPTPYYTYAVIPK